MENIESDILISIVSYRKQLLSQQSSCDIHLLLKQKIAEKMYFEAFQMIHSNNQRTKSKSLNVHNKNNSSVNLVSLNSQSQVQLSVNRSFGSSVAIHKLRESKWFNHNESNILCSVIESGFILEKRCKDCDCDNVWGVAQWVLGKEKSKDINFIFIYTTHSEDKKFKVQMQKLEEFWTEDSDVRINNVEDKRCLVNCDLDIHKNIDFAMKNTSMKWHNSLHFAHWCRYTKPSNKRSIQVSEKISNKIVASITSFKNKFKKSS